MPRRYICNCLFMVLCLTSWGSIATTYPKVTSSSFLPWDNTQLQYKWDSIDWIASPGATLCSGSDKCFFGLILHYASHINGPLDTYISVASPSEYELAIKGGVENEWEFVSDKWVKSNGMSGSGIITVGNLPGKWSLCYGTVKNLNVKYSGDPQTGYNGNCEKGGPPDTTCRLFGNPSINHGTLKSRDVENNINGVTVSIKCSRPAKVKLSFRQKVIDLGGGISSTLSIPTASTDGKVEVSNETDIRIESRLNGYPKTSGKYKGNTVLVMDIL